MTRFRTILTTVAAASLLSLAATTAAYPAAKATNCWTNSRIEAAIAAGEIQSWAKIRQLAHIPPDYKEQSTVQVCLQNGAPYFVVSMVSPKGEYFKIVLNAVDGTS